MINLPAANMTNPFRNWTEADIRSHNERIQKDKHENRSETQSSEPECPVQNEPVAEEKREAGNSGRVHVRIVSRRSRLIDPDNLCPKYFVDCLRYAGLIQDDSADKITLEVAQEKVGKGEEETIIEITL